MKIQEVIEKLDSEKKYIGYQISKKNGFVSSTWFLYKKDMFYYFFDINQKIEFVDAYKYTKPEILIELEKSNFEIELPIN